MLVIRAHYLVLTLLWQVFSVQAKWEHGSSSSSGKGNPNADKGGRTSSGRLWPIRSTGGGFLDGVLDEVLTSMRSPNLPPLTSRLSRQAAYGRTDLWDFHAWGERVVRRPELEIAGLYSYFFGVRIEVLGVIGYLRATFDPKGKTFKFDFMTDFAVQRNLRHLWQLIYGKDLFTVDLYFGVYNAVNHYHPLEPKSRITTPPSLARHNEDLEDIPYGAVRIQYDADQRVAPQLVISRIMIDEVDLWKVDRHNPHPASAFESRIGFQWYFVVSEGVWANDPQPVLEPPIEPPDQGHNHHHPDPDEHDPGSPERPETPPREAPPRRGRKRPPPTS